VKYYIEHNGVAQLQIVCSIIEISIDRFKFISDTSPYSCTIKDVQ